jgi:hypothetical protein
MSAPETIYHRIRISDVRAVDVTEITTDDSGDETVLRRSIRISGLPETNGSPTEVLELILETTGPEDHIEIETPKLGF